MSLSIESYDSLPYIDDEPSQDDRDRATAAIRAEVQHANLSQAHRLLPMIHESHFSGLIQPELDRIQSGQPKTSAVDLSRYEPPDEPSSTDDTETWRLALRNAYTSSTYLQGRRVNLDLLEELGKNAWLVGNSQLDSIVKDLEQELERLKEETDSINRSRKTAQEESKAELLGLDEAWRRGISQVVEVQLANHKLKRDILDQQQAHGL